MEDRRYTVYMHRNKLNGKVYIGITGIDPEKRWRRGNGYNTTRHFYSAVKKYGWDGFTHDILAEHLTAEEAGQMEIDLIRKYDSTNSERGYNCSTGGNYGFSGASHTVETRKTLSEKCRGWSHTEEAKRKISEAGKGRVFSEERRRHISESQKGRKLTEEHKHKLSEAKKGKPGSSLGKHYSDAHKKKLSEAHKNSKIAMETARRNIAHAHRSAPVNRKRVMCVETGEVWPSATEAAKHIGVGQSSLSETCRMPGRTCKGYHWEYLDAGGV